MIDSIYTRMQCCRLMIFLIITNSSYKTGRQGGTGLCLQPVFFVWIKLSTEEVAKWAKRWRSMLLYNRKNRGKLQEKHSLRYWRRIWGIPAQNSRSRNRKEGNHLIRLHVHAGRLSVPERLLSRPLNQWPYRGREPGSLLQLPATLWMQTVSSDAKVKHLFIRFWKATWLQ